MVQLTGGNMNQVVDQQASSTTAMSCRQKLILVISTTEQLERKQIVFREGGKSFCRKQENFASASEEEIQDNNNAVTRFEWVDCNVLLASLCYSMTGLIFIITGKGSVTLNPRHPSSPLVSGMQNEWVQSFSWLWSGFFSHFGMFWNFRNWPWPIMVCVSGL